MASPNQKKSLKLINAPARAVSASPMARINHPVGNAVNNPDQSPDTTGSSDMLDQHSDHYLLHILLAAQMKGLTDESSESISKTIAECQSEKQRRVLIQFLDFCEQTVRPAVAGRTLKKGTAASSLLRDSCHSHIEHSAFAREAVTAKYNTLNHRELQVLRHICQGRKNKDISSVLGIELSTVKWYGTRIYEKLQVKNRVQAAARAQTLKLFT